ncbi:hypothetical protein B0H13DRAFT_2336876 [Mycena leptocephala]|nr:hypothetical protein B0H13DRAFT_2336876 [Mycena leptocephala]
MSNNTLYGNLDYAAPPEHDIQPYTKAFFRGFHFPLRRRRRPSSTPMLKALERVLPALRFGLHAIDTTGSIPFDVVVFLGNVGYLLDKLGNAATDTLAEYDGIIFPDFDDFPCFKAGCVLPDGTPPTTAEMNRAPLLTATRLKHKIEISLSDSEEEHPIKTPKKVPALKKPKVEHKAENARRPSKPKAPPSISDDEEPAPSLSKGPHNLQKTGIMYPNESDDEDKKPQKHGKLKGGLSIEARIEQVMPEIKSAIINLSASKGTFKTIHGIGKNNIIISITHRQGGKKYTPKSSLGRASEADAPLEPLEFVNSASLPIDKALRPNWSCTLCYILKAECLPNGIGIECTHCVAKKLGPYCDHVVNAGRLHNLVHNFKELSEIMDPSVGSINMPHLQKLANRALATQQLAIDDRKDFADKLRKFLSAVSKQNALLGTAGLESLFAEGTLTDIRSSFNSLIEAYNANADLDAKADSSDESYAEEEDAVMLPAAKAEEKPEEGAGAAP